MGITNVIKIIGAIIAIQGAVLLAYPQWFKGALGFFLRGRLLYIPAVLKAGVGIFFLIAARECEWTRIVIVMGLLFCISGVAAFIIKLEKLKGMLQWWKDRSLTTVRVLVIANIAIGGLIIFAA
ncbi:MAG: hypothetical protein KAT00_02650 [Planctomycetes bacterium]|nr:hypothetical protein [Planctomycetota bacterium]